MKKLVLLISSLLLLSSCGMLGSPEVVTNPVVTFAPVNVTQTPTPAPTAAVADPVSVTPVVSAVPTKAPLDFTFDDIIFLGDSTTYGLLAYSMLTGGKETTQVWTPKSGTLTLDHQSYALIVYPKDDSEITIKEAVTLAKPKAMVITLGVNGVSFLEEDKFKLEYSNLIDTILATSPETTVILQSIFPVASHYDLLSSINNDKITAANKWVEDVAKTYELTYIDTYSKLVGDDGWLPQELQNGDGLHLNESGFAIEIANIKEVVGLE